MINQQTYGFWVWFTWKHMTDKMLCACTKMLLGEWERSELMENGAKFQHGPMFSTQGDVDK